MNHCRAVSLFDERTSRRDVASLVPPAPPVARSGGRPRQPWECARGLKFSSDGGKLAAAGTDGAVRVWDVRAPRAPVHDWPVSCPGSFVSGLHMTPSFYDLS